MNTTEDTGMIDKEYEIICNRLVGRRNTKSWKGDNAKYAAIHRWIHRHKPKPEKCVKCNTRPPKDVACINEKYTRDLENYLWLCGKCHWKYDHREKQRPDRLCIVK